MLAVRISDVRPRTLAPKPNTQEPFLHHFLKITATTRTISAKPAT
jgi:hypothetical protein